MYTVINSTYGDDTMINLILLIDKYMLWVVPIITIILSFIIIIISTPDDEHINLKDLLSVGVNLCISAITILLTNFKSATTAWLILFFFIATLIVAILTRKFMWNKTKFFKITAIILFLIIGLFLIYIAIEHTIVDIPNFWQEILY